MDSWKLIDTLGFKPKENTSDIFVKKYTDDYAIEVNTEKQTFFFGGKIKIQEKDTQNITKPEDWVVLECLNRLLDKGYKPENISLEKVYPAGHGTSGRLDICVTREDGSEYLLIECKTYGREFDKEFDRMKNKDGGQLFTYFKFANKADVIMLYASELKGKDIIYRNEIVKIEDEYRTGDVKDFYDRWSKLTKDNGVFDSWVNPYNFVNKALTPKLLKSIKQENSGFIFNRFLEILRNSVVSDKPNAFNKIFTLFLCKVYDEKTTKENDELKFQWFEGRDKAKGENAYVDFLLRLSDLYKNGMYEFLEKEITDFSETEFDRKYKHLDESDRKNILKEFNKIRLEKNNEFAIKEVFDKQSFLENSKIVKEVVELLQDFRIRYNKRQQYLSDFFELLLTTGLKQESGQYFTPVPIAQFIIKSLPFDKFINEKLEKGERNNLLPYVIDYAAGSGHFLTESMHEIQRHIDKKQTDDFLKDTALKIENWKKDHFDWATQYVYGIEKDYRLVKVGKVGCYLHGDGLANVILSDGLGNFENTKEYKGLLKITDPVFKKENKQFDILISNPPYSVPAFKNAARDYYTENDFDLYNSLTDNSSEIECLFVERTKQLLKDGGVAGIILPSSILSNTGIYTKSRELILENFDIVAITALGSNTFMATGTNTVVLFLRRRNNYDIINLRKWADNFFTTLIDNTTNGIEKPATKYVNHVWETITFDDYTSLLKRNPNTAIENHEIYKEYRKKLKARNEKEFWDMVIDREKEKLVYFILAYPQKVVLVNSGEKDAEKRFLGYEFSNRRGSEGIHPMQRGKHIEECTQMFDPEQFENPQKASTYIYKAFNGDFDFEIDQTLQNNISRHRLVDMLTFDRVEFEKNISLSVKKKVKFESKYDLVKIGDVCETSSGGTPSSGTSEFYENGNILWINSGEVRQGVITNSENKITKLGLQKSSAKLFPKDTVLLAMYGATAGQVGILGVEASTNQAICGILPNNNVLPFFLYNFLKSKYDYILSLRSGVARLNISQDVVKNIQIPLPPKHIQEKIVSEIEVLEEKERKGKVEVEGLKNEIQNIYTSSKSKFSEVVLSNEIQIIGGGTPSTSNPEFWDGDVPWLSIVDFKGGNRFVEKTEKKITESGVKKSSTKYLDKDDIIISARGTVGALAQLKIPMTFNQSCYGIKANSNLISDYLYFALKFEIEQFKNNSYGAIFDTITTRTFDLIKIPLPPLAAQHHIVSEIEKIEDKINVLEKELAAIPKEKELVLKRYLE